MYKVSINNSRTVEIIKKGKDLEIDGILSNYTFLKKGDSAFSIVKGNKIYNVEILSISGKKARVSINNSVSSLEISDHIDQILEKLGIDTQQAAQVKEIKAPMPGSILNVMVEENDEVQSGDPILVLEAMKMENVIKSPGDGKVSKIHISEKQNVEKNQVLITFD